LLYSFTSYAIDASVGYVSLNKSAVRFISLRGIYLKKARKYIDKIFEEKVEKWHKSELF